MSDAIERAARTLFLSDRGNTLPAGFPERQWDEGHAVKDDYIRRARALAESGLLAPAPLREEWGTRFGGYVVEGRTDAEYPFFWKGVPPPGVNVRRYRTDWLPADGISRAEGDGRDEREPTVPASQLRAFARLCVDGGDMTPAAARVLDRIIDGDGRAEK